MEKIISYFGQPVKVACDEKCNKAWGLNTRMRIHFSDDEDDYAFMADDELPEAPDDPGTYEGIDGKPTSPSLAPNKWCVRECERCTMSRQGEHEKPLELPDFSVRRFNKPQSYI